MFRIGYDAKRLFNNFTGLGNYSRTLLQDLAIYQPDNEYFLYTPKLTSNSETQHFLKSPMYTVHTPRHPFAAYWRTWGIKRDLKRHDIDIFHGLSHEIPLGLPLTGIKSVVTMHDLIYKRHPELYPWLDRHLYDYKYRYACEQADCIVAISESTKRDIVEFYGIAPDKIKVIYQSCHERFARDRSQKTIDHVLKKYALPSEYLFYVGSVIPRKNLLNIVKAMRLLPPALQLPLVVVGEGQAYYDTVKDYIRAHGLTQRVHFIRPDFVDLPALYQQADIFLYPSFYEGFGIPILEAMLSEAPVITSNVSSLPEAAGPDSALVDPHSPEAIAEAIERILTDTVYRQNMVRKGFEYARRFNGEDLTQQLMGVYETVAKS